MLGLFIGIAGGLGELFLLGKLVRRITGKSEGAVWPMALAKAALLAAALGATAAFVPAQLIYAGTGIAGVLIGGSVIIFLVGKKGGD